MTTKADSDRAWQKIKDLGSEKLAIHQRLGTDAAVRSGLLAWPNQQIDHCLTIMRDFDQHR